MEPPLIFSQPSVPPSKEFENDFLYVLNHFLANILRNLRIFSPYPVKKIFTQNPTFCASPA